jgi:hypothetical protein
MGAGSVGGWISFSGERAILSTISPAQWIK